MGVEPPEPSEFMKTWAPGWVVLENSRTHIIKTIEEEHVFDRNYIKNKLTEENS